MWFSQQSLAFCFIVVGTSPVFADSQTYQSPVPAVFYDHETAPPSGYSGQFVFEQFDPSLGTLESLTLNLQGECYISDYIEGNGSGTCIVNLTMGAQDLSGNANADLLLSFNETYSLNAYNHFMMGSSGGVSGTTQATFSSQPVLDEFTGRGSINLPGGGILTFSTQNPAVSAYNYDSFWELNGSVTYNYSPVPEAAGFGFSGGALCLLAVTASAARRWRKFPKISI